MRTKVLAAEIDFDDGIEYIATTAFATAGSDTPANQLFRAKLYDCAFERSVSFAVWRGDRSVSAPIQELVLPNADGRLDSWLDRGIKDRTVVLKSGYLDQPYSTWTVRARLTGDRIKQASRTTLVIAFKSKLQLLQRQSTASWEIATPNTEVRGSRRPIVIGRLLYAGGVLYQHVNNFERLYSVSDFPIHSITQWWSRYVLGSTPGYYQQGLPEPCYGLRRRTSTSNPGPDDRVCLEMRGAIRLGTEMLGDTGEFDAWSGDDPDGWTVTEGSGLVYESPTGVCVIDGEDVWISWVGLTVGVLYHLEVLTDTVEFGVWQIMNGASVLNYEPFDAYFASSPRTWRLTFTATATDITIGVPVSATGKVGIARVRCWPATPVDRARAWIDHLCLDRGSMSAADIDGDSLDDLESAKPYDMAFADPQGSEIDDLLWAALDSLNAAVFEGADGRLHACWLQDPSAMTPIGTILDADFVESLEWEDDEMDGLSTNLQYSVNYAQLSESEIQTLTSAVSIPQVTIESLRRADRKAASSVTPHSHYTRAGDQTASNSLLVHSADAQAEVNARCTLANVRRRFGRAALRDREAFAGMEPGQCWTVVSSRWGTFDAYVALVRGTLLNSEPVLRIRVWR